MKSFRRVSGVVLAGALASVALVATPAAAAEPVSPTFTAGHVKRVSKYKAKVKVYVTCPKGSTFSLFVEVLQDLDPSDDVPLDAYYTATKLQEKTCTGHRQRLKVKLTADRSGSFAVVDGRLRKGPASVDIGGTLGDEMVFEERAVRTR